MSLLFMKVFCGVPACQRIWKQMLSAAFSWPRPVSAIWTFPAGPLNPGAMYGAESAVTATWLRNVAAANWTVAASVSVRSWTIRR